MIGSAVEDPVVATAEVAAQLAKLASHLRGMRERQVRLAGREEVQAAVLRVNDCLVALRQKAHRVVDRDARRQPCPFDLDPMARVSRCTRRAARPVAG